MNYSTLKNSLLREFPGVQWRRLWAPKGGSLDSIPGQGARSHRLQLRPGIVKQINKNIFKIPYWYPQVKILEDNATKATYVGGRKLGLKRGSRASQAGSKSWGPMTATEVRWGSQRRGRTCVLVLAYIFSPTYLEWLPETKHCSGHFISASPLILKQS